MYSEISTIVSLLFIIGGLWLLTWSANRFVDGSAALASRLGVPPFVIGMVVIGFGTSAPEMAVRHFRRARGTRVSLWVTPMAPISTT